MGISKFKPKYKPKTEPVQGAEEPKVCAPARTREEEDLRTYEILYKQLQDLGIRSIGDLENLIAKTRQAIK